MVGRSISFVITNYNYAGYVEQAILSCINQERTNIASEIIIVDDGSDDSSPRIISSYKKSAKILLTAHLGLERAFNAALKLSTKDFVVRVDADDYLLPDFLKKISSHLDSDVDVLYGDYQKVDLRNKTSELIKLPKFDKQEILGRGDFLATGTVYRKGLFRELSMYSEKEINCGLENFELILNCLLREKTFKKIDDELFCYRVHDINMSEIKRSKIRDYGALLFDRLGLGSYKIGAYHPYFGINK